MFICVSVGKCAHVCEGQRSTSIVIRCCLHVPPYYFLHVYVCVVCSHAYMFSCVYVYVQIYVCVHAEARC